MNEQDYEKLLEAYLAKEPKEAIHGLLAEMRDYLSFVNKIAELLRLSDGISEQRLDQDITVGDIMLTMLRKGERVRSIAEIMYDYANQLDKKK